MKEIDIQWNLIGSIPILILIWHLCLFILPTGYLYPSQTLVLLISLDTPVLQDWLYHLSHAHLHCSADLCGTNSKIYWSATVSSFVAYRYRSGPSSFCLIDFLAGWVLSATTNISSQVIFEPGLNYEVQRFSLLRGQQRCIYNSGCKKLVYFPQETEEKGEAGSLEWWGLVFSMSFVRMLRCRFLYVICYEGRLLSFINNFAIEQLTY